MQKNTENAVSPVVSVILLVAIVIILAATVAAFAFGMAPKDTTKIVSIHTEKVGPTNVTLTIYGGMDVQNIETLKVKINGGEYQNWNAKSVGESKEFDAEDGITGNYDHIVVLGIFNDQTNQIILDTHI